MLEKVPPWLREGGFFGLVFFGGGGGIHTCAEARDGGDEGLWGWLWLWGFGRRRSRWWGMLRRVLMHPE